MEHKYSPCRRFAAGTREQARIREQAERGFTLIEVLIVVSIIAILATMTFAGVQIAQRQARNAQAKAEVSMFSQSIDMYYTDEKTYPGRGQKQINSDSNQFPDLYLALLDMAKPEGRGGRNAPYIKLERERIVVEDDEWDEDTDDVENRWVQARRSQVADSKVKKYYLDPFRTFSVYVYRCNKGKKAKDYMHNLRSADIYSTGSDENDQTRDGSDEENDDIGNW